MAFGLFRSKGAEQTVVIEFRIGDSVHSIGTYPDTQRPKKQRSLHHDVDRCWVAPGQQVEVAGRTLRGPIYCGQDLAPVTDETWWVDVEPSLVNPSLAVAAPGTLASPPESFWSTGFEELTPEQRGVYLDWHAAGRRVGDLDPYYVRLFLWGVERRVLVDAQKHAEVSQELPEILAELTRMRDEASEHRALEHQIDELIQIIRVREFENLGTGIEPPRRVIGWSAPLELRIGLGAFAETGEKVSARWALAWVRTNPTVSLRTPAIRCEDEFDRLFAARFDAKYPDGLAIKPLKSKVSANYRPTSPGISGNIDYTTRFSDIVDSAQLAKPLGELVADCSDSLDSLSRLLGRKPDLRGSLEAIEVTPVELIANSDDEATAGFRALAERVSEETSTCIASEVFAASGMVVGVKIKKSDFTGPSRMLEKFGVGFEPDPRFDAHVPGADEELVLFRLPKDRINTPTNEFLLAAAYLHLAAGVAGSDGVIDDSEFERLHAAIREYGVTAESEVVRLGARLENYRRQPPAVAQLKARAKRLKSSERAAVLDSIVAIAFADGNVAPSEIAALTKIYEAFEVPPSELFAHLHATETTRDLGAPAAVGLGSPTGAGEIAPETTHDFKLNRSIIEQKARETEAASALLGEIFAEEEIEVSAKVGNGGCGRFGLDGPTTDFLDRMLTKPSWPRAELDQVALEIGVLLDGTLETINETAYDLADAPLWDGDDPIDVYPETIEEMNP